jgi:uncharacterized protein YwgA
MTTAREAKAVANIISDAGNYVVGRTRLQKLAYILEAAGLGEGFAFRYKHYGPYSEDLATASNVAVLLGTIKEMKLPATWGGSYSTFSTTTPPRSDVDQARLQLAHEAARADAVELELAATALFLAQEGIQDPWAETARRKPDKAGLGRLNQAKELYNRLRQVRTPRPLPRLD